MPASMGGPQPAPPAPINMVPGGQQGGYAPPATSYTQQPVQGGYAPPPAISFGAPPPGGMAPPPMVPGRAPGPPPMQMGGMGGMGAQGMGGVAPPPMMQPPPMMSPGSLSGGPGAARVPEGPKVLVGFLVTFQNDPGGSFWPIHSGRTQLGRSSSEGVDIALQDASASSKHASIHADPATGQGFVEDDGSRNGTFLNEARLSSGERRQLRDNDRLRLGSTTFVVKLLVS
jgi:hypothetical protein